MVMIIELINNVSKCASINITLQLANEARLLNGQKNNIPCHTQLAIKKTSID